MVEIWQQKRNLLSFTVTEKNDSPEHQSNTITIGSLMQNLPAFDYVGKYKVLFLHRLIIVINLSKGVLNKILCLSGMFFILFKVVCAQDSLSQDKINNLNDLREWNKVFLPRGGARNVEFDKLSDVKASFNALNWQLFADARPDIVYFYNFFTHLASEDIQNVLTCFSYYRPLLDKSISAAKLPGELEYLPLALSMMDTKAGGSGQKNGLWQLTHFQGVLNGLEINRLVDERLDVRKATNAAIAQIKKNEIIFNSCERAIIGYLAGNTRLQNCLALYGPDVSTATLLEKLPDIAATISAWQAWGIFISTIKFEYKKISVPDTVSIKREMHLRQINRILNIPQQQIQLLNLQYRYAIVPGNKIQCEIQLPAGKKADFVASQDAIFAAYDSAMFEVAARKIEYPPAPTRQYVGGKVKNLKIEGKIKIKYTLKTGDVLGFIAERYDVRVADLKYWNNIYNARKIRAGQTLDIFVDEDKADYYRKKETPKAVKKTGKTFSVKDYLISESAKKIEHVVQKGESPYVIAQKYEGVTPEKILHWNGIRDARKIQIGQKLIIYVKQ